MPVILEGEPTARKDVKNGRPIRPGKSPEVEYRRALLALNKRLKEATAELGRLARTGAGPNTMAQAIRRNIDVASREFDNAAERLASSMTNRLGVDNKEKIEREVRRALGVSQARIIDPPQVREILEATTAENVSLIRTIPEEHFARVSQAIFANYRGEPFPEGSLTKRLQAIGGITDRRAKFIARDQTAKFVASVNEVRQKDAGIIGYLWRGQRDEREVGNPGGKYPKGSRAHHNHWDREGKFYTWDNPPAGGHPGSEIGCRCWAEPVIDIEKVKQNAL